METEKMKTQNGQLWFCGNKEGANVLVVLLHCSFHNVNHKKFQSSGKTQLSRGYLIVFFDLVMYIFLSHFRPEMSYEVSDSLLGKQIGRNTVPLYFLEVDLKSWSEFESRIICLCCSVSYMYTRTQAHTHKCTKQRCKLLMYH